MDRVTPHLYTIRGNMELSQFITFSMYVLLFSLKYFTQFLYICDIHPYTQYLYSITYIEDYHVTEKNKIWITGKFYIYNEVRDI